ncbi:hypothetical protein B1C78_03695 [Thioalkalivibrio denitrificans]|uniref:Methyltransferase type 11 domain-containing protein n=1 Tax=Thioalkalivibrio denitrificans TaxID=108003 RepID=A0A1V3NQD3_9GAMM|nr:methyltransferase domain-containing protein [Thioalkalivibrio denitrificans]OOG27251.1 hypothetical protein B1C78_03695 [Thioalkalivibrio denitrificans]
MDSDPYQEMLDDPSLPFEVRWRLISEIDGTNQRFGVYKKLLADWDQWMAAQPLSREETVSVFEVGSGSGGLSREIRNWGQRRGLNLDMHLYDAQEDVLQESLKQFDDDARPAIHVATDAHLEAFPDRSFDYVISLHVIHHIRPFEAAASAMEQMLRISRIGVFVVDFENKPWAVPFAQVWNRLHRVSPDLSSDGIKSLKRAYSPIELMNVVSSTEAARDFSLDLKRYFFVPYWRLCAMRQVP